METTRLLSQKNRMVFGITMMILILVVSSCKKEKLYLFQVENETEYDIDVFSFAGDKFRIRPLSKSDIFNKTLVYDCFCFSEPLEGIGIDKFSDSTGTYQHLIGQVYAPADASTDKINIIKITMSDSVIFPTHVFKIVY